MGRADASGEGPAHESNPDVPTSSVVGGGTSPYHYTAARCNACARPHASRTGKDAMIHERAHVSSARIQPLRQHGTLRSAARVIGLLAAAVALATVLRFAVLAPTATAVPDQPPGTSRRALGDDRQRQRRAERSRSRATRCGPARGPAAWCGGTPLRTRTRSSCGRSTRWAGTRCTTWRSTHQGASGWPRTAA